MARMEMNKEVNRTSNISHLTAAFSCTLSDPSFYAGVSIRRWGG